MADGACGMEMLGIKGWSGRKHMSVIRVAKKINSILSLHQKRRIIALTVLMVIGGLLEMFSVSMVLPFMSAVMDPEATMGKWYAEIVCELFNIGDARTFLLTTANVLALFYILKNIYLMLEFDLQYRFSYGNMLIMQNRVLDSYIHRSYEFFLQTASGEIVRVINTDIRDVFLLLTTLLTIFTETVASTMLVAMIAWIAPLVTLIMTIVLALLLLAINCFVKPILRKEGYALQKSGADLNKWLLQSVQGIKDIKITSKENYFQENFNSQGYAYVESIRKHQILTVTPRFCIEAISMSSLFVIVATLINRGAELESIIPMLTAVAMAAIRLLPSANRISNGMASIAYYEPLLDNLIKILTDIDNAGQMSAEAAPTLKPKCEIKRLKHEITLHSLFFHYPDTQGNILCDASMTIRRGESVGIVGGSGAGKTTVADILLGLLHPQSGQVLIDGVDIATDMKGWHDQIGYIPQMIFMLDDTIRRNVAFGEKDENISDEAVWRALEDASLADFVRSLPHGLDTEIGERGVRLSGGQRQRIGIARALYRDPCVMVFDEATSALDNTTEAEIMESVRHLQGQKTMIIIAHRLTTIEHCDHVYRVENGKITLER